MADSEQWYEHTDTANQSSFDVDTSSTVPANTAITVTIYEDAGDDGGANSVTDVDGVTHDYDNSASFTLSGGSETTTVSGFAGDGSASRYLTRVEIDNTGTDPTNDSADITSINYNPAGSGGGTTPTGILATTNGVVDSTGSVIDTVSR